jgi:4-hydroxy 2-oxovalerate aldolase
VSNIKVLDCTLRDGGYINDWNFGKEKSKIIVELLQKSDIDYIEIGFITTSHSSGSQTLYDSFDKIKKFLPKESIKSKIVGMITYGQFPLELVPDEKDSPIGAIRVIFKKDKKTEALEYCRQIKAKGYKLFINPTYTDQYSEDEFDDLLKDIQIIKPYCFSIVDSMGVMKEKDILRFYHNIDNTLSKDIALCIHSHNNLQLSFSNAQCLMKICHKRELIIDSTVFGMGRGAGNLCTELITQYINDNYKGHYYIVPILKIVDEQINPIFAKTPWGYSVPYYLAATNHCHPNYAKYLVDKQTVPVEIINELLKSIPDNKKAVYDVNLIKQIYLDNFSEKIEDFDVIEELKQKLRDRNILIMAPGKSLLTENQKIIDFIKSNNPYIISLNFIPNDYNIDVAFISNLKRFASLDNYDKPMLVTSNIENVPQKASVLNYSSYLNNSKMYDNSALMCLKMLITAGVKKVYIAGLDGFSNVQTENYVSSDLINNAKESEFYERNFIMSEELNKFAKNIKLNFITKTNYEI